MRAISKKNLLTSGCSQITLKKLVLYRTKDPAAIHTSSYFFHTYKMPKQYHYTNSFFSPIFFFELPFLASCKLILFSNLLDLSLSHLNGSTSCCSIFFNLVHHLHFFFMNFFKPVLRFPFNFSPIHSQFKLTNYYQKCNILSLIGPLLPFTKFILKRSKTTQYKKNTL